MSNVVPFAVKCKEGDIGVFTADYAEEVADMEQKPKNILIMETYENIDGTTYHAYRFGGPSTSLSEMVGILETTKYLVLAGGHLE